jgi:GNAT superfamily N-acetyltransferase
MKIDKSVVKPGLIRINRSEESEVLYQLEERLHEVANRSIKAWLRIKELDEKKDFWGTGLPQHLFDYLESWDRDAAEIAALAFLEHRGYSVTKAKAEAEVAS